MTTALMKNLALSYLPLYRWNKHPWLL